MNFETGALDNRPTDVTDLFIGTNSQPQWSADGRSIAFLSERPRVGRYLVIRTLDTAATKEFRMGFERVVVQAWSPDGSGIAVIAQNPVQAATLFRVDTRSGEMTEIARNVMFRQWSSDGKKIVFDRQDAAGMHVVERDLSSGAERELHVGASGGINRLEISRDGRAVYYRDPVPANAEAHRFVKKDLSTGTETVLVKDRRLVGVFLSPDERYIVTQGPANVSPRPLLLVPTDGGESRDLGQGYGTILAWAPDSRSIVVNKPAVPGAGPATATFWWVPIDGRPARQLNLSEGGGTSSAVVAGVPGLAFQTSTPAAGADVVWVLENFLPKPVAGRGAGGR
jgi:dipeptidyl aminopeptidase/acylaminoacyl peptidase